MSKIISDEKFLEWCGSHTVKGCGKARMMIEDGEELREAEKCEDCRAEAQRDSSDREWIEAIDEMISTYQFGDGSFINFQDKYQALKQKVKGAH